MRAGDPARDLAQAIARRGLAAPARLLLDAHRPVAPLIGDAAIALGPLLGSLVGRRHPLSRLASEPSPLERLMSALEAAGDEGSSTHADPGAGIELSTEDTCPHRPS